MAQVLDARRSQMLAVKKSETDLQRVEEQIDTVLYGSGLSYEFGEDSLRGLSQALSLELAGRGRVWKNGQISTSGEKRVFKFPAARLEKQDSNQEINGLANMILFAYSDRVFENDDNVYPVIFVGSFRVSGETPDSIELEPVFVSDREEYSKPTSSWTLFEKSPADQRDAFIRDTELELNPEDSQLNQKLTDFRTVLTENQLRADSFGFDLSNPADARKYEMMIDRVMFDGLPLVKIESWIESQSDRIVNRFDPPNEEVFVRFRFDNVSSRPYQVDAEGNIENDGQFTKSGYAVDPSLHAGGEIEFKKGDVILVDQLTADGYQRGDEPVEPFSTIEPVTEINRIFVRQLRDYPYLLNTLSRQIGLYSKEIERVKQNNVRSQQAISDANNQSNLRDEEIEKLFADQGKFEQDVEVVKEFLDSTRIRKSEMETQILDLESQIKTDQRKLRAIDNLMANQESLPAPTPEINSIPANSEFLEPSEIAPPSPSPGLSPGE